MKTVEEVLGIPDPQAVNNMIVSHPEYQGDPPTDKQLKAWLLCHPEYGGLTERAAAKLLGCSRSSLLRRLNCFFEKFPYAKFPPERGEPKLLEFRDEMETKVRCWW